MSVCWCPWKAKYGWLFGHLEVRVVPGGESVHTGVRRGAVDERALEQINGHLHRFFIGTVLFLYWHLHRVFYWHQFVFLKEDLPARAAEIRGWL